mmetsp:Transcript_46480/g.83067  ORF Transcript_46480/g.83067 Transcript_46480/m.83067 type:complete len:92 (+) Transcript_46480:2200-2475(+)
MTHTLPRESMRTASVDNRCMLESPLAEQQFQIGAPNSALSVYSPLLFKPPYIQGRMACLIGCMLVPVSLSFCSPGRPHHGLRADNQQVHDQ